MKPDCIIANIIIFFSFLFFFQFFPHNISNDVTSVLPLSLLTFFFFLQNREKYQPILTGIYICIHFPPFLIFLSLLNVHCERSELKFTALGCVYVYLVEFSRVRGWLCDFGTEATTLTIFYWCLGFERGSVAELCTFILY